LVVGYSPLWKKIQNACLQNILKNYNFNWYSLYHFPLRNEQLILHYFGNQILAIHNINNTLVTQNKVPWLLFLLSDGQSSLLAFQQLPQIEPPGVRISPLLQVSELLTLDMFFFKRNLPGKSQYKNQESKKYQESKK